MTDLGDLNYAELLAHLRKDLQLNLSTDAQAHRLPDMGQTVAGQGVVWDGTQWVAAKKNFGLSWGTIVSGSATITDAGSGDWSILGTATGAVQLTLPVASTIIAGWAGPRQSGSQSVTVQAANPGVGTSAPSSNPVISVWVSGALTNGFAVTWVAIHV